jgi:hypothetical protein
MLNNYIKEQLTIDLQNGLTKQSSSYTIWFQMRWGMTSCLNHDYLIFIFIHFPYLKLLRRYARCCWHLTLHTINVEKNVSRFLFQLFPPIICLCITWVWWRWGCFWMYCSSFRNFTFCFYWFLFYFRLLVYI